MARSEINSNYQEKYNGLIRKAVITAGGMGTRLLPATKEIAKEMLPLISNTNSSPILKPMLQLVFESLYSFGIRNYCFIVGRNRRSVEDHFSINMDLRTKVFQQNKILQNEMTKFYGQLRHSHLLYLEQLNPRGFGDAVLHSKKFVGDDDFILHTGDDIVIPKDSHLKRLDNCLNKFDADVGLLVQKVSEPRNYGVIQARVLKDNYMKVVNLEEKPKKPKTNLAIVGIYSFKPLILDYIKFQKPDKNNEIQLTHAIQNLLEDGHTVVASKILTKELRLDVGTPENYMNAFVQSYKKLRR